MTTSEIFKFTEKPPIDESIQEYEFHEYEPQARPNLNSAGEISIQFIKLQDLFTHPCESYLIFEGRLTKQDGTAYANTDAVSLTNNGIMCLFSNFSYRLPNHEIEAVYHPGQATTMLGLLKYSDDFSMALGLNQLWKKIQLQLRSLQIIRGLVVDINTLFNNQRLRERFPSEFH